MDGPMSEVIEHEGTPNGERAKKADAGKFKFDSTMSREDAVAYFQAIVDGLKHGIVNFKQGDRSLTVNPASVLDVEVKASSKGKEKKITFEISWRAGQDPDLEITSS